MKMLMNGLYSPAGYRLALKVRDNCEFKSEAWEDAQEIVVEISRKMIQDGSTWMYCEIKGEIEDMLDEAEGNPSEELDERIDKEIDLLYVNNHDLYMRLQEEVELPERWMEED